MYAFGQNCLRDPCTLPNVSPTPYMHPCAHLQIFPRHILEQLARLSAAPPNLPPANQSDTTGPAAAAAAEVQEEDQEKRLQAAGDGSQLSMAALTRMATYSPMITVLFADCVSFTNMCQQVPPAAVMAFLNDLFSRFDAKIGVHGVWKVETAGDACKEVHDVLSCHLPAPGLLDC